MEFDIYWSDLRPEVQEQILDAAGIDTTPEEYEIEMNWGCFPCATIIICNPIMEGEE